MKHFISTTLLLLAILLPTTANAYDFEVDGIYYVYDINSVGATVAVTYMYSYPQYIDGGVSVLCYYSEYSGNITIPSTVTYDGITYTVTSIDDNAFNDCTELTSVEIPNSVTHIGERAFSGCSVLTRIIIPNSVITIGSGAFSGTAWYNNQPDGLVYAGLVAYTYKGAMPQGTNITLSNGTLGIADYAFSGRSELTSITIPNSVVFIGENAFSGTTWYNNQPDGLVYAGLVAYKYKGTMPNNTGITIIEGTLSISPTAFMGRNQLTSINIPNSVTRIGNYAFYDCRGLTSITIPNSVSEIGNWAFNFCYAISSLTWNATNCAKMGGMPTENIEHVNIGPEVEILPSYFVSGSKITEIIIPSSVKSIGDGAFTGCDGLTCIDIPNTVNKIGEYAFANCSYLTSVTIPNSISEIDNGTFYGCCALTSINIPNTVTFIGANAFSGTAWYNNQPDGLVYVGPVAYKYKGIVPDGASICIKEGTRSISPEAFYGCEQLASIIIPNSVTSIGNNAFNNCPRLISLTLPVLITYGRHVFHGSSVQSLILTGEGAFQDGSLDIRATNVYIDTGVTEIEGILVKPTNVYCYSNTPSTCDENTFTEYSATLHVPAAALAAYFTAPYWSNFINIVGDAVEPQSVTINQDTIYLRPSMTQRLMAIVTPTDASGTIVWNSTNNNVASVENGQITAIAPGECDIIANCFSKQAICHVIVTEVKPTSITINQEQALMETGSQLTLSATVLPDSTTYKTVEWSSSDVTVATVDNGIVTAVHAGECDIIAQCQNVQAICHVTVTGVLPTDITLSQESAMMKLNSKLTLSATVLPDNTTYKNVTWSSSDESIATVDNGVVTAVGVGECDIMAQCRDLQAVCHLTVVQFTLDQHEANLLPNHILTLVPDISPIFGNIQVSSSDPTVAAARLVNGIVQVVGIKEGTAAIILNSADGYAFSDSCLVEVYTERGDVNCDGFVNISDGTVLIDILLGGDVNHSEDNADCNNDGKITISDLTALIDALLGGAPLPEKNYEVINVNGVSFKMMKVQGGTFTMGATPEQGTEDPWNDEWPTHEVTVSSFCIGQTEVTQELWQAVMGTNPSYFTGNPTRPVETVSWDECQQFIATLNQLTGMNFRMPTEAEWEYAARGGNKSEGYKYAGSNDINETAWWDDNAGDGVGESSPDYGTHPVALKKANELGLYDMSGNVWEWCQDWYGTYSQETQINPTGPETGTEHLYRGGSWLNYARNCRVSCRFHWVTNGVNYVGLRLVK